MYVGLFLVQFLTHFAVNSVTDVLQLQLLTVLMSRLNQLRNYII